MSTGNSMSFNVAALGKVTASFIHLTDQVDRLSDRIDRLDRKSADITVKVDDRGAQTHLKSLSIQMQDLNRHAGSAHAVWGKLGALWDSPRMQRNLAITGASAKVAGVQLAALGGAGTVAGVAALGNALIPVAGAAGLLPAVFAAAGAAALTLKIGATGVAEAFKSWDDPAKFAEALKQLSPEARATMIAFREMKPAMDDLRLDVQDTLFRGLSTSVRDLGGKYIPVLRTGLVGLATEFNSAGKGAAAVLGDPQSVKAVSGALANMRAGFAGVLTSAQPLTRAIVDLVSVGSTTLPGIGNSIGSIATEFARFISESAKSGQLKIFFDQAVESVGNLLAIIGNLASIIFSLFRGANVEGFNLLGTLREITGSVAAFLKSTEGKTALHEFFSSVREGIQNAMPFFRELGYGIAQLFPLFQALLPLIGGILGALAPAVQPLVAVLKALLPVAVQVAQVFAQVLLAAVQALAPVVLALAPLLGELVRVIGGALIQVIQALAPPLLVIAQAMANALIPVLPVLADAFVEIALAVTPLIWVLAALAPIFADIVSVVASVISALAPLITIIGTALTQVLTAVAPQLAEIARVVGEAIVDAVTMLTPLLPPLIEAFTRIVQAVLPLVPPLVEIASTIINALLPFLPQLVAVVFALVEAFLPLLPPLLELTQALLPIFIALLNVLMPIILGLANVITAVLAFGIANILVPILNGLITTVRTVGDIFTWLWQTVIIPAWHGIQAVISGVAGVLHGIFDGIRNAVGAVARAFEEAVAFIGRVWDGVKAVVVAPINFIIDKVYNHGIVWLWNQIAGLVGLGKLNQASLIGMSGGGLAAHQGLIGHQVENIGVAGGGVLRGYTPGRDSIPALLSPGEAVLVPELVRAIGARNILALNAMYSGRQGKVIGSGGMSGGGVATFAGGGAIEGVLGFVGGVAGDIVDLIKSPFEWIKSRIGGAGSWVEAAVKMPVKLIGSVIEHLWSEITAFRNVPVAGTPVIAGGGGAGVQRWAPIVLAVLALLGQPASLLPNVLRRMQQESGGNPNAINLWDCLPIRTRILTRRGWLSHDEVRIGDETIGFDPDTGCSRWTKITRVVRYPSADILRMGNKRWMVESTPNHRWLVHHRSFGYRMTETRQLGTRDTVILAMPADTGSGLPISVAEAALLGWIAGDGTVERNRRGASMSVSQSKRQHFPAIERIFTKMPHARYEYPHRTNCVTWRLTPAYARDLIARTGHPKDDAPKLVLAMSTRQRAAWLNAMIQAEGTTDGKHIRIFQCDGPVAEAIELAVYLSGHRPTKSKLVGKDQWSPCWSYGVTRPKVSSYNRVIVESSAQDVWCVTTELGTWTAEQDGQMFLTGNSNARRGTPSIGLMQTIAPTFQRWAGPYVGRGIYDPFANVYAGLNYALHRYPSLQYAMDKPGGYSNGKLFRRPTFGLMGESGDELLLPLSRPQRVEQLLRQAGLGGDGEVVVEARPVEKHYHLTVYSTNSDVDLRTQFRRMEILDGGAL